MMGHSDHFEFSSTVNELLFENFHIYSSIGLIATCVVLALIAVVYEGIRLLRDYLSVRSGKKQLQIGENSPLQQSGNAPSTTMLLPLPLDWSTDHLAQSALHMAQMFVGYLLMLSVMTYNGWILVSILIGAGIGGYVMRPWPASHWLAIVTGSGRNIQRQQESNAEGGTLNSSTE